MTDYFTICGAYGDLKIDAKTGLVDCYMVEDDAYLESDPEAPGYRNIEKVDVAEWEKTYERSIVNQRIDILDIGVWSKGGFFEPFDAFHREHTLEQLKSCNFYDGTN